MPPKALGGGEKTAGQQGELKKADFLLDFQLQGYAAQTGHHDQPREHDNRPLEPVEQSILHRQAVVEAIDEGWFHVTADYSH